MTREELERRAKLSKLLLLDVDGVMTDGSIILSGAGDDIKHFNVQDGMGVTLARAAGLKIGILTGRSSVAVQRRAEELKMDEVCQGYFHKGEALDMLVSKYELDYEEIAYIGDDILDLPVMRKVGLPIAVANARPEVKAISLYVTTATGGHGAVREAIDWLLELRGQKEALYELFASGNADRDLDSSTTRPGVTACRQSAPVVRNS